MNGIHMRRFRNVPPLQYLLGFEAAARLGSFGQAAEELGLTQSAISHQMRLLEAKIGQPLFLRIGRSVRLTDAGRDYQRSVAKSLDQLENGYRSLSPYRKAGSVVIYAPRDFAALWLMPKLHLLLQAVPECDPWIDTSGAHVNFDEMEVSIAIRRMREHDEKLQCVNLVNDVLVPVMAPKLLKKPISKPIELLNYNLLHDERAEGWRDWFAQFSIESNDIYKGPDFNESDFALMAAELGLGVALSSLVLVEDAIAARRLVRPIAETLATNHSWFAITSDKELADPVTARVWAWFTSLRG